MEKCFEISMENGIILQLDEVILLMDDYEIYKSDMCSIPISGENIVRNTVILFENYNCKNYSLNRNRIYGSFLIASEQTPTIRTIFRANELSDDELFEAFKMKKKKLTKHKMKTVAPIYMAYFKNYIDLLKSKSFYCDGYLYNVKLTAEKLLYEILSSPDRPNTNLWLELKLEAVLEEITKYISKEIAEQSLLPIASFENSSLTHYNFLETSKEKVLGKKIYLQ